MPGYLVVDTHRCIRRLGDDFRHVTQFGLHLVKCTDKKSAAPPNYDLAKPRIEAMLKQRALGTELQNRLKRDREAAIIVRNYETGA